MLAANEAVAKKLLFAKQPAIYRVHDRPDPDRLVDLREVLESFGYELKGDLDELAPAAVPAAARSRSRASPRSACSTTCCCARSARPSTARSAAATTRWRRRTTATSRRRSAATRTSSSTGSCRGCSPTDGPSPPKDFEALNERFREVAAFASERERRAEQAERESLLWKKIVFMRDKVGREFDAYATGVASFGVFVTLRDFFVEGLVPMSALGNDFFVYEEKQHRLRGRATGKTYRLGDSLRVRLVAIDEVRRRLDFRLAEAPERPPRGAAPVPSRRPPVTYGRSARRRKSA